MNDSIQQIGRVIKNDPAVENVIAFTALGPASTAGALHKVDGPPIDRLSLDQINRIDQTCFLHHDLDDPRVPYTSSYCEKLDQERNRRAMLTPGQRTVIVGGQPVKQLQ